MGAAGVYRRRSGDENAGKARRPTAKTAEGAGRERARDAAMIAPAATASIAKKTKVAGVLRITSAASIAQKVSARATATETSVVCSFRSNARRRVAKGIRDASTASWSRRRSRPRSVLGETVAKEIWSPPRAVASRVVTAGAYTRGAQRPHEAATSFGAHDRAGADVHDAHRTSESADRVRREDDVDAPTADPVGPRLRPPLHRRPPPGSASPDVFPTSASGHAVEPRALSPRGRHHRTISALRSWSVRASVSAPSARPSASAVARGRRPEINRGRRPGRRAITLCMS